MINNRKAAIIGCGFVGASTAFSLMHQGLFSELMKPVSTWYTRMYPFLNPLFRRSPDETLKESYWLLPIRLIFLLM